MMDPMGLRAGLGPKVTARNDHAGLSLSSKRFR
jgi:hypothetical protein